MRTLTLPYAGPSGAGRVEYALTGAAPPPATLFLHGLAGSIEDTRPLASGVPGRKIFAHLPGHGGSTGPDALGNGNLGSGALGSSTLGSSTLGSDALGYDTLAAAALAVADHERATAAFGVSLGAATLLRILTSAPDRFDRVVLYLPAVADIPRTPEAVAPHHDLADRLAAGDAPGVAAALLRTQPLAVRDTPIARDWAERRAKELIAEGGDPARWLPLASAVPLKPADRQKLSGVHAPVLVIAQEGDPAHPVEAAHRVAAALPTARLEIFDAAGALWGHRHELRALITEFLTPAGNLSR